MQFDKSKEVSRAKFKRVQRTEPVTRFVQILYTPEPLSAVND